MCLADQALLVSNEIIDEANQRLRGLKTVEGRDADDLRDRLLAGFEQVLVDEYQDIDNRQYDMLAHIARKAGHDEDRYAAILAVGDDDQSIYAFRGANTTHMNGSAKTSMRPPNTLSRTTDQPTT